MKKTDRNLNISIEDCFKIFEQSFTRVKYFTCITDNFDLSMLPSNWNIENSSSLKYCMNEPNEADKQMLTDAYKHFIQCYLVRDCIESFVLSLDKLFYTLQLHGKKIPMGETLLNDEEKKDFKKFEYMGYGCKIKKLKKNFN